MGTEFLSDSHFTGDIATLPLGAMAYRQSEKEFLERSDVADKGFWGTTWEGLKTSPIINSAADFIKNHGDYQNTVQDAKDWDDTYDWHEDAKRFEGLYPREIFVGSMSEGQSRRAMANYDDMVNTELSFHRRPVATALGKIGAFGFDAAALNTFMPFIGGIGGSVGRSVASEISNSILKGAVKGSIAFALDIAEVNLARGMLDERLILGDIVDDLPVEMLYGALLGGAFGSIGGAIKGNLGSSVKEKILKQLKGGTTLPVGKFSAKELEEQSLQLFEKLKEVSSDITPDQVSTLVQTIGGVEANSVTEQSSKMVLSRLACDPTTRAYGSKVPFVRNMARKLHDSHLPIPETAEGIPSRSLDITVQTMQNEVQGRAKLILDEGYKRLTDDLNNFKTSKEEFNKLVGSTLVKNGQLDGAYDPQFSHYIEETAQRYIKDVRENVQDAFISMKKARHGKDLIEKSRKSVARAKKKYDSILKDQEKFGTEVIDENIQKEYLKLLKTDINKGKIQSPDIIERSRMLQIGRVKKRFSKLREQSKKSTAGKSQESLLKDLDASEKKSIGEILRESEAKTKQFDTHSKELLESITNKWKKQAAAIEEEISSATKKLEDETKLLKEREGGTFESDIEGWLQSNDEGYTHRMYDYPKIMANPQLFIEDVTRKLVELEGMSYSDAARFANELYNSLLTSPVGRKFNTAITLRGAEKHRTLQIATEVVENWLDTDAQKMAEKWSESVIPDSVIQNHIGTYDANDFSNQISQEIKGLVKSGKVLESESNDLYRTSISQIQRMIDNVRGLSYRPEGAVYDADAWRFSAATRSLVSMASMGGLVFTSLFDVASMMLNKGFFRFLEHDTATFLKYISRPSFRSALKNHPDLISMSGWLDAVLSKGTNRTLADYGIPVNYATRTTEFLRKASQLQQKITGAEAIFHTLHLTSDYGNLLTIARVSENVAAGKALSATEKSILNLARISEKECLSIAEQISKHGITESGVRHFNLSKWENSDTAHAVKYGVNALTKNSILTPGNEVPAFARTALGEVLFQYKKFIFASIDRCFLPTLGRLSSGEISVLGGIFSMVAIGGLKESLSRLVAGRDPLTAQEFWLSGIGNCDALPLIGEIIKDVAIGFNSDGVNGGFEHAKGWLHDYFVPAAASQAMRGITGLNGVTQLISGKRQMNAREMRAIKTWMPYNNAIYLNWLLNKWIHAYSDDDNINFGLKY